MTPIARTLPPLFLQSGSAAAGRPAEKARAAVVTRVGQKKALYVECLYQRNANEGGAPRACTASDSRIDSFTDDLAPIR